MQIKTKIVSCHTAESKPVEQEVNGTVILPPLEFPGTAQAEVPIRELKFEPGIFKMSFKKRVLVQNKSNLLLKIILNTARTLQLFTINKTN